MSIEKLKKEILVRWNNVPAANLCGDLVDFLANSDREHLACLTYTTFANALDQDEIDQDLLVAISILANHEPPLLERHLLFDGDDDKYEIKLEDFEVALKSEEFISPETGEKIDDYAARLIPYFTPSKEFYSVAKH